MSTKIDEIKEMMLEIPQNDKGVRRIKLCGAVEKE